METHTEGRPVQVGPAHVYLPTPEQRDLIARFVASGKVIEVPTKGGSMLYVPYGPGRAIPMSFAYEGADPVPWRMIVQTDPEIGIARCTALTLLAPMGKHITAEMARVPLGRLLDEAVLLSAIEVDAAGRAVGEPIGARAKTVAEARRLHKAIEREHRRRKRVSARNVTDDLIEEVARVYNAAVSTRRPTAAVEAHFPYVSRSTINRWVAEARARELIEPSGRSKRNG